MATCAPDIGDDVGGRLRVARVVDDHCHAIASETLRDGRADAARGACDDGRPARLGVTHAAIIPCPYELGDLPKPPDQFARRTAVGILATDRAPCRNVAGTPPGSDVRSWLGVRFIPHPFACFPAGRG
jgi:hypothetical protein